MRILAISNNYPVTEASFYGVFCADICEELARLGHSVRVLTRGENSVECRQVRNGVEIIQYPYAYFGSPALYRHTEIRLGLKTSPRAWLDLALSLLSAYRALKIYGRDCDLVHAFWYLPSGLVAAWAKTVLNKPLVVTSLGGEFHVPENFVFKRLLNFIARKSDAQTAFSRYLKNRARSYGLDASSIEVVPNSMRPDLFPFHSRPVRAMWRFLVVSRFIPSKRVGDAIEALARLPENFKNRSELWVVGTGPEGPSLERLAQARGVSSSVRFMGVVPHPDMPGLLAQADTLINPTAADEGMPTINLEAMATGLCVIATNSYSNDEVIEDGKTGWLYAPGRVEELASRMRHVLEFSQEARRMGEAASVFVRERHDARVVARRYEAVYERVLGKIAQ